MVVAIAVTALAVMVLAEAARSGRLLREIEYLKNENNSLRDALIGRDIISCDDTVDTKWFKV